MLHVFVCGVFHDKSCFCINFHFTYNMTREMLISPIFCFLFYFLKYPHITSWGYDTCFQVNWFLYYGSVILCYCISTVMYSTFIESAYHSKNIFPINIKHLVLSSSAADDRNHCTWCSDGSWKCRRHWSLGFNQFSGCWKWYIPTKYLRRW